MKKLVALLILPLLLASCAKDPFTGLTIEDSWVIETSQKSTFSFDAATRFIMPDSALIIRGSRNMKMDTLTETQKILLNAFRDSLVGRGYQETNDANQADMTVSLCYVQITTAIVSMDPGFWDLYYYMYWPYGPNYFVSYNVNQAIFLSLQDASLAQIGQRPEGVWTATMRGEAVFYDFAFPFFLKTALQQSPYLKKS